MMKMSSVLKMLVVASATMVSSSAFAMTWVDGGGKSCFDACQAKGKLAIASGTYQNGQHMFICAANANGEGERAGYNLKPNWANACWVGHGGQEKAVKPYKCMCK